MKTLLVSLCALISLSLPAAAQGNPPAGGPATGRIVNKAEAAAEKPTRTRVQLSEAGRVALANAKDVAGRSKGLRGAERTAALEQAAAAYDKVVAEFPTEPAVAAAAAFAAAELWQQHGSLPLAEKDFLLAAETDGPRFGQRGLLGAAEMQRRQKRFDDAMATYGKAAAAEPGTVRAQEARLWQARLLQSAGRIDDAIPAFQTSLESAKSGSQVIEAANYLALAWIQKGDHDAAERAVEHAEQAAIAAAEEDPILAERLGKSVAAMSARKALQRARDKASRAAKDAVQLDRAQQQRVGGVGG